jgi:hypothetical protein
MRKSRSFAEAVTPGCRRLDLRSTAKVEILVLSVGWRVSVQVRAIMVPFLKTLSALALGLSVAGCAAAQPTYPNVVPIDTTGNFGAR